MGILYPWAQVIWNLEMPGAERPSSTTRVPASPLSFLFSYLLRMFRTPVASHDL